MRWHRDPHGAGQTRWKTFSAGDGPDVSVEAEQQAGDSLLHYYAMLIGWRREIGALRDGTLTAPALANPRIAAWQLDDAGSHVLVLHNLSGQPQQVPLGNARFHHVLRHSRAGTTLRRGRLTLPPYASAILD
jgi:glycosidase